MHRYSKPLVDVVVVAVALELCRGQQVAERAERWQMEPAGQASAGHS